MITSIADAYLDSTPLVAITAQVMRSLIGRGAFQETDVFGMTAPIVKHSYLVTEPEELPRIIKEAFYIASTGRPGPVLIDMPKDVQEAVFTPDFDMEMDIPGYNPVLPVPTDKLEELIPLIENARRPVIYAGGGISFCGSFRGASGICGSSPDSCSDHPDGHWRHAGNPPSFPALAGHARSRVCEVTP